MVLWGSCGTACNLFVGRLIDSIGNRRAIVTMLVILAAVLATLQWSGAHLWTTAIALAVWGSVGWGLLVPQQHRLVLLAPQSAPVVLGLNTSFTYLGVTAAGLIGAVGIRTVDGHHLGVIGAVFAVAAIGVAELASWRIKAHRPTGAAGLKAA